MSVGAGVERNPIESPACGVKLFHDRAFAIVLDANHFAPERRSLLRDATIYFGKRLHPVDVRLPRPEQIQIRPVNDEQPHPRALRGGNGNACVKTARVACSGGIDSADRIVSASAADGSFSIVAGVTTNLVRETYARHHLSLTASAALGRLLSGAALLGATLKGRERMTLQVAGDGPLGGLVADSALKASDVIGARGYAQRPGVEIPLNASNKFDVATAVGKGFLQVTRSFEIGQPYVGIVPLRSGEIGDDIAGYLAHSQQIPSVVALGVLANREGIVASGGIIAQVLPGADEVVLQRLEQSAQTMAPVTRQIAEGASPADLIRALTGDFPLRAVREYHVEFACRCSREAVETVLMGLGRDELEKIMREQTQAEAVCEYCKKRYVFSADELRRLIDSLEARLSG